MFIDLNADIGESFGSYKIGMDEEIMALVSSVNVACGFHAGDPTTMAQTVLLAKRYGVSLGAHPGYQDLLGFGRRFVDMSMVDIKNSVIYQLGALKAFADHEGVAIKHVKPHGALYNAAAERLDIAMAIAEAIYAVDASMVFLGLSGSKMIEAAKTLGLRYAREGFADRRYTKEGQLVSRALAGAVIEKPSEAAAQVLDMLKNGAIKSICGNEVPITVDSICVHGDHLEAIAFIRALKEMLHTHHVTIKGL